MGKIEMLKNRLLKRKHFHEGFAYNFINRDPNRQQATLSGETLDGFYEAEIGGFGGLP